MGDVFAFRSEIDMVAGKSGADKRSSPRVGLRKTLGDLTNIQPRNRPSIVEHKVEPVTVYAKGTDRFSKEIESLKKENLTLKKQLAERNKIVELSATEIQTLRENFQTLYQQNLQLAQANSQMMAELNSGKDRLKALHHELGCVKGLLNVRTMELQEKKDVVDCQQTTGKVLAIKSEEAKEPSQVGHGKTKRSSNNSKRQSKVTGKSAKEATDKEKSESKRLCVRRQSSRFKSEETTATEDLFELEDIKLPISQADDTASERVSSGPEDLSDAEKDETGWKSIQSQATETRRRSIGRPPRRAAEKVQSYKEVPLNVKMRRNC